MGVNDNTFVLLVNLGSPKELNKKILPVGFEEKLSKKQLATELLMLSLLINQPDLFF